MAKYYVYDNASRRLRSGKYTFSFEVVEQFAGAWRGVLEVKDEEEIKALESFAASLGIREIPFEVYESYLKKKTNSTRPSPDIIRLPTSHLKEAAGHVVLKEPSALTIVSVSSKTDKPTIDEVIKVGVAPYTDPLEAKSGRKKK